MRVPDPVHRLRRVMMMRRTGRGAGAPVAVKLQSRGSSSRRGSLASLRTTRGCHLLPASFALTSTARSPFTCSPAPRTLKAPSALLSASLLTHLQSKSRVYSTERAKNDKNNMDKDLDQVLSDYENKYNKPAANTEKSVKEERRLRELVVNLEDAQLKDPILGGSCFVVSNLDVAKRFPLQVESAIPENVNNKCPKCSKELKPCVVTTFPLSNQNDSSVWAEYPLALDGFLCRNCSTLTAPRYLEPSEFQKLQSAGIKEAKARNFGMAEFLLRRAVNSYPARLNIGGLFMDLLNFKEKKDISNNERDKLLNLIVEHFEAAISPNSRPVGHMPSRVYTTLARIYMGRKRPIRSCSILQKLLDLHSRLKKDNQTEGLKLMDMTEEEMTYARSLLSKSLAELQRIATNIIGSFAYYGDAETRVLSQEENAQETLNIIDFFLHKDPEVYGYLMNTDRYAVYYFLGKCEQVLDNRSRAAGYFLQALKQAGSHIDRKTEAALEYAGDFLHCYDPPNTSTEDLENCLALLQEVKIESGDKNGNVGSSIAMLQLAKGDWKSAEAQLRATITQTNSALASGILAYIPDAMDGSSRVVEVGEEWESHIYQ